MMITSLAIIVILSIIAVVGGAFAWSKGPALADHPSAILDAQSLYGVDDLVAVPAKAFRQGVEQNSIAETAQPAIASLLSKASDLLAKVIVAHQEDDPATFFAMLSELSSVSSEIHQMIAEAWQPTK